MRWEMGVKGDVEREESDDSNFPSIDDYIAYCNICQYPRVRYSSVCLPMVKPGELNESSEIEY